MLYGSLVQEVLDAVVGITLYLASIIWTKRQNHAVDAPALPGRRWAVWKDMTLMSTARRAMAFSARIQNFPISFSRNCFWCDRLEVAGPACSAVKFVRAGPQSRSAADAMKYALALFVVMLRRKGSLCAFFACYLKLLGCQKVAPLSIGFLDGECGCLCHDNLLLLHIRGKAVFGFNTPLLHARLYSTFAIFCVDLVKGALKRSFFRRASIHQVTMIGKAWLRQVSEAHPN
jgi:hypothetical protein